MGPLKQQPSIESANQNFALINFESNSETLDNHVEKKYSAIDVSSIHWTDYLEIVIVVAAGLFFIKHLRKYLKNKKKKEQAPFP